MSRAGKRVAVIGGGRNCEHDVSLASAAAVREALREAGYWVEGLIIDREGRWRTEGGVRLSAADAFAAIERCQVVFPALHGPNGEDGTLAAVCELLGRPCVGSGLGASAIAMDKWASKLVVREAGIAIATGTLHRAGDPLPAWTGPVVVKPVAAGSSFGVAYAESESAFEQALAEAFVWDSRVLVEELVCGIEVDVGIIEFADGTLRASVPLEIRSDGIFDTATKYDGTARFIIPAEITAEQTRAVREAALAVFRALGCRGLARVDFFITEHGVVFNEINTMPGLTEHSQLPRMFAAEGMSYRDLVDTLVMTTLQQQPDTRVSVTLSRRR